MLRGMLDCFKVLYGTRWRVLSHIYRHLLWVQNMAAAAFSAYGVKKSNELTLPWLIDALPTIDVMFITKRRGDGCIDSKKIKHPVRTTQQ